MVLEITTALVVLFLSELPLVIVTSTSLVWLGLLLLFLLFASHIIIFIISLNINLSSASIVRCFVVVIMPNLVLATILTKRTSAKTCHFNPLQICLRRPLIFPLHPASSVIKYVGCHVLVVLVSQILIIIHVS